MGKFQPLKKTMSIFEKDGNFDGLFRFNEFVEDIVFYKKPEWDESLEVGKILDDENIVLIKYYLSKIHDFEPNKSIIGEACFIIAKRRCYHPIKQYIEAAQWDGVERLDHWLIHTVGCPNNAYTRQVSAKFLIAAVNRVYRPGCKFDHMLILESEQGTKKSTLVEELANQWYLDTNFGHKDKDLIDCMRGAWIIEISELSGMGKKDVDWLKSFLSRKVDRVRLAYAARSKDFKRKCVFIGTYNPSGNNMYLRDDTGNRRFWPIVCGEKTDIDYVIKNRSQLWAEALVRFKAEEKYYIDDPEALEILSGVHRERELESPTFHTIKEWLKGQSSEVLMVNIIEDCLKINTVNKMPRDLLSVSTTIGIIMRRLRWRKGTNDNSNKYYCPDADLWEEERE